MKRYKSVACRATCGAFVVVCGSLAPVHAQDGTDAGILTGRPAIVVRRAATAPAIDGRLDDPAWQGAARVTSFAQQRPLDGESASEPTEVLIAYDSDTLFLGIHARYSDPGLIRANRVDRDQIVNDDKVSVYIDPFLDQQRAYVFAVNGYGVQSDGILSVSGGGSGGGRGGGPPASSPPPGGGGPPPGGGAAPDLSWDALFQSAGRLVDDGWVAEVAIPFKSLRYPARGAAEAHQWGFQIQRDIEGKNESVVWAPVSRRIAGFLTQMGLLEGLTGLSPSRNLELLPTFTAVHAGTLDTVSGRYGIDVKPEGGFNVKYGVTSNLTMDVTFNPDFSQIESDRQQIEVNQRYPLFYSELRPFFVEGQEIFQAPGPVTFVHTRTIINPRYGAKLSGKVGRTAVGVIVANDEAAGIVDDPGDPAWGRSAQFLIGRLRYDLYSESSVGILVTDREFLDSYSRVAGVDAQFRLGRTHRATLRAMASDHRDLAGVRSSGPVFDVALRRESRNLNYGIFHNQIDPGFRTDVGFVQRVDVKRTNANMEYRWWPEHWIISWGPRMNAGRTYGYGGTLTDQETGTGIDVQFARNITFRTGASREMERYGGVDFWKTRTFLGGSVNTSRRVSVGGFFNRGDQVRYVTDRFLGRGANLNMFLTLRPFARLRSQIDVTTSRLRDARTDAEVFEARIVRAQTTYQFTDRLLARNIVEHNTLAKTVGLNVLLTYRVNSGTVFYLGYDDRLKEGTAIDAQLFPEPEYRRTNRAVFTKLQYLFRY